MLATENQASEPTIYLAQLESISVDKAPFRVADDLSCASVDYFLVGRANIAVIVRPTRDRPGHLLFEGHSGERSVVKLVIDESADIQMTHGRAVGEDRVL